VTKGPVARTDQLYGWKKALWSVPAPAEFAAGFTVGGRDGATSTCPARWVAVIYPTVPYPAPSQGALGAKVRPVTRLGWNGSDRQQGPQTDRSVIGDRSVIDRRRAGYTDLACRGQECSTLLPWRTLPDCAVRFAAVSFELELRLPRDPDAPPTDRRRRMTPTGPMKTTPFFEQLESRCREIDSLLCVGLDPHPSELGGPEAQTAEAAAAFCLRIIEATSAVAAAYKPNAAFFEAYGAQGAAALERVVAAVPAGIPVLLDAKRGDIGSTAAAYATAAFSHLQVSGDAYTCALSLAGSAPLLPDGCAHRLPSAYRCPGLRR
jgi:hypothetical protein